MSVGLVQRRLPLALAFLLLSAAPVMAGPGDVQVSLTAHRVGTDVSGHTILEPGDQARPGDVIEYRVRYSNQAPAGVRRLVATLPIPHGMEYLPRTAQPARVEASLDGHAFAPIPLMRKVRLANGREEVRPVPPAEYRHLRWTLGDLAANGSRMVAARVRVAPAGAMAAAAR